MPPAIKEEPAQEASGENPAAMAEVIRLADATFRVTQSLDFARVDFRLHTGENRKPYILEINSLPGLTPIGDLSLCVLAEGWGHNRLIPPVRDAGARRYGRMGETDAGTVNGEKKNSESAQAV